MCVYDPGRTPSPNELLLMLRTCPAAHPGTLQAGDWTLSWGAHGVDARSAGRAETVYVREGDPVALRFRRAASEREPGCSAEPPPQHRERLGWLQVELEHPGVHLRLEAPPPDPGLVADLPLAEVAGEAVDSGSLFDLTATAAALGASLTVPVSVPAPATGVPGVDRVGVSGQAQLVQAWARLEQAPEDSRAFRKLEALYLSNLQWWPLVQAYERYPGHGDDARLLTLLHRIATLCAEHPQTQSAVLVQMGHVFERAQRFEQAAGAYFKAFRAWPANVPALTARIRLAAVQGDTTTETKLAEVLARLRADRAKLGRAYMALAAAAIDRGQRDLAATHLAEAAKHRPDDARVSMLRGLLGT